MTLIITKRCRKSESIANESNGIFTREEIDARTSINAVKESAE